MAKGKKRAAEGGPGEAAGPAGPAVNKMDGVRQALDELGRRAKPAAIQDYLRDRLGIEMSRAMISNYKSILTKKAAKSPRRPRGQAAGRAGGRGGISLDDIKAVKNLAARLGADRVRALIEVLAP